VPIWPYKFFNALQSDRRSDHNTVRVDLPSSTSLSPSEQSANGSDAKRATTCQSTVTRSQTSLALSAERCRRLYCSVCRVKLNSDRQAEQHYRGKLHARKSRMLKLTKTGGTCTRGETTAEIAVKQVYSNYCNQISSLSFLHWRDDNKFSVVCCWNLQRVWIEMIFLLRMARAVKLECNANCSNSRSTCASMILACLRMSDPNEIQYCKILEADDVDLGYTIRFALHSVMTDIMTAFCHAISHRLYSTSVCM